MSENRRRFIEISIFRERQETQGTKSGEQGGWSNFVIYFLEQKGANTLEHCSNCSPRSERFLRTASHSPINTSKWQRLLLIIV